MINELKVKQNWTGHYAVQRKKYTALQFLNITLTLTLTLFLNSLLVIYDKFTL